MIPRLHIDAPLAEAGLMRLNDGQSHYLKNVLRRTAGDRLRIFNARDGEFSATIDAVLKAGAQIRIGERLHPPGSGADLWLLFAPVKRDAVELIIEKATELGVSEFHPVVTERTQPARLNQARLAAIAIEAAEQCGRLSVPRISAPSALGAALDAWSAGRRLIYCDEAGDDPYAEWGGESGRAAPMLDVLSRLSSDSWAILIGPEGGFSPAERARLRSEPFVSPASLGPLILRAETAAIAALALWQAACGGRAHR